MKKIFELIKKYNAELGLGAILAGFLAVSLSTLSRASIWFDEAFSAYIVRFNFAEIWHYTSVDVHPPFYYFLLKIWSSVFGLSDFALRAMSVMFGFLTILAVYFLVRRIYGKKLAVLASGLLAFSPMLVRYSQEARMYTMVAFIGVITVRAFYEAWLAKNSQKSQKEWRIVYILAVCCGIWTQYLSALIPISLWIFRAVLVYKKKSVKFLHFRKALNFKKYLQDFLGEKWLSSHLIIAATYLPWIPFFVAQAIYVKAKFWIPALDFATIPNMFSNFFFYLDYNQTNGWLSVVIFVILAVLAWFVFEKFKEKKIEKNFWLIFNVAILPIAILYLASLPPLSSIFVDRYLLMAEVFVSILLAILIFSVAKNKKNLAVLLFLLVAFSHILGLVQINLQRGVSKNGGEITEIRQAIERIRKEQKTTSIAVGGFLYYSAAQYSNSESKIWFYGEPPIYRSGDMIRAEYTPKLESGSFKDKTLFVLEQYSEEEVKSPIKGYRLVHKSNYKNSIDGKPLYRILKFIAE